MTGTCFEQHVWHKERRDLTRRNQVEFAVRLVEVARVGAPVGAGGNRVSSAGSVFSRGRPSLAPAAPPAASDASEKTVSAMSSLIVWDF